MYGTWNQQNPPLAPPGRGTLYPCFLPSTRNQEPGTRTQNPEPGNKLIIKDMIHVEKPTPERLEKLGVDSWPIWEKEVSVFPWEYDEKETCYILEGEVEVTPGEGEPVSFGKGDLVIFSEGLKCIWNIKKAVKKHYKFG